MNEDERFNAALQEAIAEDTEQLLVIRRNSCGLRQQTIFVV